jgi:hypothetical protein
MQPYRFITDGSGHFRIFGLAPGDYFVMTESQERVDRMVPRTYFPDTLDPMAAATVTVVSGGERPGVALTVRSVPSFRLTGTVLPPDGYGGYVSVRLSEISPLSMYLQGQSTSVVNGRFVFGPVKPGRYWLLAEISQRDADARPGTPPTLWWAAEHVVITDSDRTDAVLALQRSMSLAGRIVSERQVGELPLNPSQLALRMVAISGAPRSRDVAAATGPDAEGNFTVMNLTPGRYRLTVAARNGPAPAMAAVVVNGRTAADAEIEVTAGTNLKGVVVRIR